MKLENSYVLPAPPERVWAALNDPETLRATLPGCRTLTQVDERHFDATIQVRVGPVSTTFRGQVELGDLNPPRGYTLIGSGNAGAMGFAKLTARIDLQPQEDATLLRYDADVEVGGKLMSVGARLIQSVSAQNLETFFAALRTHLAPPAPAAAAAGAPAVAGEAAQAPLAKAVRPSARAASAVQAGEPDWKLWFAAAASALAGLVVGFLAGHFL